MAGGVSVEKNAVQGGINCCKVSIRELETASRNLQRDYRAAGSYGWQDKQYAALGYIVSDCCNALTKPVAELQECLKSLEELLVAIREYENTNL